MRTARLLTPLALVLASVLSPARAEGTPIVFSNTTSLSIPDNNFPGVSSSIVTPAGTWTLRLVDDSGGDVGVLAGGWSLTLDVVGSSVVDVNVTLLGLTHTFFADLDIALFGPVGIFRDLTSDNGGSQNASNATLTFDDEATISLTNPLAFVGGFVVSGSYLTEGTALSIYDGLAYNDAVDAVPEPATLSLLGTGLLAIAVRLRRRART